MRESEAFLSSSPPSFSPPPGCSSAAGFRGCCAPRCDLNRLRFALLLVDLLSSVLLFSVTLSSHRFSFRGSIAGFRVPCIWLACPWSFKLQIFSVNVPDAGCFHLELLNWDHLVNWCVSRSRPRLTPETQIQMHPSTSSHDTGNSFTQMRLKTFSFCTDLPHLLLILTLFRSLCLPQNNRERLCFASESN